MCVANVDVSLVKIKTEADSNDIEYSHDDKPSTGMFAVSDDVISAVSCLYILCFDCYCIRAITRCAQLLMADG